MNYIKSIKIQGYQSHINNTLYFTPGLNIITGDTNSGKTAILRAITLALFNKPWNRHFINKEESHTAVELIYVKDGSIKAITRVRSYEDDVNDVILNGEEFKSFGKSYPEKFVKELELDNEILDIIYSSPLDRWYLLGRSGIEKAKKLVAFSDIVVLDKALKICKSRLNRINRDIEDKVFQEKNITKKLEKLKKVDDIEKLMKTIEDKDTIRIKLDVRLDNLYKMKAIEAEEKLIKNKLKNVEILTGRIKENTLLIENYMKYKLGKLEIKVLAHNQKKYNKLITKNTKGIRIVKTLEKIITYNTTLKHLKEYEEKLKEIKNSIKEITEEIDSIKICPTCGRPL